jgi:carbamoyl-phosphate synthase large subunit
VQGAAACVQGIEALVRGDIGVLSLQEHHLRIRPPAAIPAEGTA